jgi:hypothetical protein
MTKVAVLVGAVAVAVFATAALTGNAGVNKAVRAQARAATLQQQVNELRQELICLETVTGDGLAQDYFKAASAIGTPKQEDQVDDRGVCKKLGVVRPGTYPNQASTPAIARLLRRAFGG